MLAVLDGAYRPTMVSSGQGGIDALACLCLSAVRQVE